MNDRSVGFHFNGVFSDFAAGLGELCFPPGEYVPQIGDTLNFSVNFSGVEIYDGVITEVIVDSDRLNSIYSKLSSFDGLSDDDVEYLSGEFDFSEDEPNSDARGVIVRFESQVTSSFVKKKFGELPNLDSGREITAKNLTAIIIGNPSSGYEMTIEVKAFVDGHSVISTKALDEYKEMHARREDVENVAWSDDLVSTSLIEELNTSIDEMCKNEPADYHPGSGKVVRDVVHPSMYCYAKGFSEVKGIAGDLSTVETEPKSGESNDKDFWGRSYEESIYQWLPAEIHVSNEGKAKIDSYINNLDRRKYPNIYLQLEGLFESVLPLFEAVCGSLRNDFYGVGGKDLGKKAVGLRDRKLQVVTKIVEYRVNREENFDGVWHVEGMSHEEVMATALCIIQRDENFSGAEIEFRRFLYEDEGNTLIYSTPQNAKRPTDTMGGGDVRPLGRMETPAPRVIVFPNSHIHRLSSMYSSDGKDATRRIVVFWLVNPDRPIISTANVAEQQKVMSLDQALRNRLALMAERKLHKESYEEREVFLCEH
jgi:hypothetical protein